MVRQTRRGILAALGATALGGTAGCMAFSSDSTTSTHDSDGDADSTPTATATATPKGATPTDPVSTATSAQSTGGIARLLPDDGDADDAFGDAVAIDGEHLLVGAPADEDPNGDGAGSAYVFRQASGTWTQTAKLTPAEEGSGGSFGISVALSGETALVGAMFDEENGSLAGAAYVFVRSDDEWRQQAKILPDDGDDQDAFGSTAALSGDTAVLGATYDEDPNGTQGGAAYVFTRSSGEWTQAAKLAPETGSSGDVFGGSLALVEDTLLVGAPATDGPDGADAGATYVFRRAGGDWARATTLTAGDRDGDDGFGEAVALSGETALVGAAGDEDPSGDSAGSAYVFRRSGEEWTQAAKLAAENGRPRDNFGRAAALTGGNAVVGAVGRADGSTVGGTAYLFTETDDGWRQRAQVDPTGGDGNGFGRAVAASDGTVLVGAGAEENDNGSLAGAAYLFPASSVG